MPMFFFFFNFPLLSHVPCSLFTFFPHRKIRQPANLFIVGVVNYGRIRGAAVAAQTAEDVESGSKKPPHVQCYHGGEQEHHGEEVEGQQQGGLQHSSPALVVSKNDPSTGEIFFRILGVKC